MCPNTAVSSVGTSERRRLTGHVGLLKEEVEGTASVDRRHPESLQDVFRYLLKEVLLPLVLHNTVSVLHPAD